MFADIALAARIEHSETHLLIAASAEIARRRGDSHDGFAAPLAGGVATYTGPGSPLNKVAGLGFGGPLAETELDAIERSFAERNCPVQVELSTLADPTLGQLLTRRGYVLMNFENVLGVSLAEPRHSADTDSSASPKLSARAIAIDNCAPAQFETWLNVVATGFAAPDTEGVPSHESFDRAELDRVIRDMATAPGFMHYLACRDGANAGGASMFIGAGVAHLAGAATLPAHRRRGVQTALLAHRLRDARERGCEVAVVTTQPGSKSQQNAQRRGFELIYSRAVLVK
ncbi:MAG: GNAT family N-acetyltransferase [Phycisphaerae bacterium]